MEKILFPAIILAVILFPVFKYLDNKYTESKKRQCEERGGVFIERVLLICATPVEEKGIKKWINFL